MNVKIAAMIAIFSLLLSSCGVTSVLTETSVRTSPQTKTNDDEIRGVWIASAMNINFPSLPDLTADELKAELDDIIAASKSSSLNAIFFQVRPSCDALYASDIFPTSRYLYSDGAFSFDPLDYLVSEAHKCGITVHTWINPFRITASGYQSKDEALASLPDGSPAKADPNMTVFYADGKLYFDPGLPAVRQLVADGAAEIARKYNIDGIVIDDYFYPYPVYDNAGGCIADFDDEDTYRKYGGCLSKADFRRTSVNRTVEAMYRAVKDTDPDCLFGVSPYGIWQNDNGTNGGSDTVGLEAYSAIYCDALAWIGGGYIDYIAPQIPWRMNDENSPFGTVASWWESAVDGSTVKLIVSLAPYRYDEWDDPNGEMTAQIGYARSLPHYCGCLLYGYDMIKNNKSLGSELVSAFAPNDDKE